MDGILFLNLLITLFCTLFLVLNGIRLLTESAHIPVAKSARLIAYIPYICHLEYRSFAKQICIERPHLTCQQTRAGTYHKLLNIKQNTRQKGLFSYEVMLHGFMLRCPSLHTTTRVKHNLYSLYLPDRSHFLVGTKVS